MGSVWSDGTGIQAVNGRIESIWNKMKFSTTPYYKEVGSNFNGWRMPVSKFAPNEENLAQRLHDNVYIGEYDMPNVIWQKSGGIVDEISHFVQVKMKEVTARCYPSLVFGDFVKQGSSREGLKIRFPNEFDMILPFIIEGVDIRAVPVLDNTGALIPALVKLQISDPLQMENIMNGSRYQSLRNDGVFEKCGSDLFLNAMCFQMQVISSIMDTTISEIQTAIDEDRHELCSFTLSKTSVFPPTYKFKIVMESEASFDELIYGTKAIAHVSGLASPTMDEYGNYKRTIPAWSTTHKVIEFDIVPGLLLQTDAVPNPNSWFSTTMACDRYAVMKWINIGRCDVEYPEPHLLWRESSSGYEKHIIDVGSKDTRYLYILTACRITKAYLDGLDHSSPLCSMLSSYHMKNIAIHCILLQLPVSGVKEALGYFMVFLEIVFEMEFFPHFFYGNPNMVTLFPNVSTTINQKRLNLFKNKTRDHFVQALLALRRMKGDLRSLFTESPHLDNQSSINSFKELCTPCAANKWQASPFV